MTLGAWIFLSVLLVLVVVNKPFRKFFLWAAALCVVCFGFFYGYVSVRDWRERRTLAREAAIQQKKQDDCNARLNALNSSTDRMLDYFERRANAETCRANPDVTVAQIQQEKQLLKPGETLGETITKDSGAPDTLPADFFDERDKRKVSHEKTVEGIVRKDAVVYSESSPAGPGGQVLGKVESGTHVRVIRLDSMYGNVQVRTPKGITGWLSNGDISY